MSYRRIEVRPVTGALGAEIGGVALEGPLDDEALGEIRRALVDHQVIFFRDQRLGPEQQVALTARFGPIARMPFIEPMPDHPDVIAVLKEAEERNISTFGGTWHSDFSFLPEPPMGSLLYALEVPECGGDTLWADMYRAYEALSPGLRNLLDGMAAIHSGAPYGTTAPPPPDLAVSSSVKMSRGDPAADIETEHPVVRVHPESGRRALFVNPVYTLRFKDMTAEESGPLLGFLYAHATRPEFTCRFQWRAGSVAFWDNRCTLHLAINDYDGRRRLLHRTTVAGERPQGVA
jgi:taurine dioxygenase